MQVVTKQLFQVRNDYFGIDELHTVVFGLLFRCDFEQFLLEGLVYITLQLYFVTQQTFQVLSLNHFSVGCQVSVSQLGGEVEDRSEQGGIDFRTYFIRCFQSGNVSVIEPQPTIKISVEGRRRKDDGFGLGSIVGTVKPSQYFRSFFYLYLQRVLRRLSGFQILAGDLVRTFHQQLQHETGLFATIQSVRRGVVEQRDILCPLNQTVEVVSVYCVFMFDGRHTEGFAEVVGDEGGLSTGFRKLPLVERQHDKIAEIEVTCLQHSHDLQSDSRFSVEGDIGSGQHLSNKTFQGIGTYA